MTITRSMRKAGIRTAAAGLAMAAAGLAPADPAAADAPRRPPGPVAPSVPGRCPQYEPELRLHAPAGGWDVELMSSYIWRESACDPAARSARDTGLLQINDINHPYLRTVLREWVGRWSLTQPAQNIRAAAALCTFWRDHGESCYFPWKLDLYRPPNTTPPTTPPHTAPVVTPAPVGDRCPEYESLLAANAPAAGWDVGRMSRLMFTMSRCDRAKRWSTATGLLRISDVNHAWLSARLRLRVDRTLLTDPVHNIRAAAALCQSSVERGRSCYQPWGG